MSCAWLLVGWAAQWELVVLLIMRWPVFVWLRVHRNLENCLVSLSHMEDMFR